MKFNITATAAARNYHTREQLYALCVLLCWGWGLALSKDIVNQDTVTLLSTEKGNTGLSAYMLEMNPNATDVAFSDVPSLPDNEIYFSVLGVPLIVTFNEDGVGMVTFANDEDVLFPNGTPANLG